MPVGTTRRPRYFVLTDRRLLDKDLECGVESSEFFGEVLLRRRQQFGPNRIIHERYSLPMV